MTYPERTPAVTLATGTGPVRTIGIVACSAEGAALCYRTICSRAQTILGPHTHPEIALHGFSLAEYVTALDAANLEAVGGIMLRSADKLAAMGADFLICPDNTIHAALDHVRPYSPLPWLHIADVVAEQALSGGVRRAALLGTRWLVDSPVYPDALSIHGIDCVRPEEDEKDMLAQIIMDELVNDVQTASSTAFLTALISDMKDRGCDAVILGCTELPLVLSDRNSPLPTLDSTRLLADAALRHAISERRASD